MLLDLAVVLQGRCFPYPNVCNPAEYRVRVLLTWYCPVHAKEEIVKTMLSRFLPICIGFFESREDLLAWLQGEGEGSHLCHVPSCICPGHIVPESKQMNSDRTGHSVLLANGLTDFRCSHIPKCVIRRALLKTMDTREYTLNLRSLRRNDLNRWLGPDEKTQVQERFEASLHWVDGQNKL